MKINPSTLVLILLMAGSAEVKAEEASTQGLLNGITFSDRVFVIEGKTFTASPSNTVGAKLSELKEGDKITVESIDIQTGKQPINAMRLEKVE
jgi:hypothetical protein